jgi:hypothetical protein
VDVRDDAVGGAGSEEVHARAYLFVVKAGGKLAVPRKTARVEAAGRFKFQDSSLKGSCQRGSIEGRVPPPGGCRKRRVGGTRPPMGCAGDVGWSWSRGVSTWMKI